MVSSCVRRISLLVLALSVVIAVIGETRAGTCDSGERNAPVSTLYTENTCATITGQKIRVNPRIPALNKIERRYYMEAEVIMLREMEYGGRCFRSSEQNSLGLPYHIQLNTSLCDCTHTPGVDIFPGTNVARRYVRVEFECRGGFSGPDGSPLPFPSSFSLSLDVNSVNASIAIPHTAAAGPNVTTWDYYEPDSIKFNVTSENWPWSSDPSSYIAFWQQSTVQAPGFNMNVTTQTDALTVDLANKEYRFKQEVQRSFVLDDFSYLTYTEPSVLRVEDLPEDFSLATAIAMCWNDTFIENRTRVFKYDPTLSALFVGSLPPPSSPNSPKSKSSRVVAIVVPVVVVSVLLLLLIFVIIAMFTPAVKNFFRPFRNPNKDASTAYRS